MITEYMKMWYSIVEVVEEKQLSASDLHTALSNLLKNLGVEEYDFSEEQIAWLSDRDPDD